MSSSLRHARRAIRRSDFSARCCLLSIHHDQQFVSKVIDVINNGNEDSEGYAVFANLRCGLWYMPLNPTQYQTCYFKSTDGHTGQCSFSLIRLNFNVAMSATRVGGCIIVDATRRGKRFPDSMLKTIPIWCCVMNRALHRYRKSMRKSCMDEKKDCDDDNQCHQDHEHNWDCELYLPVSISHSERSVIEFQLDDWASELVAHVDMEELSGLMRRPLRPMWISSSTRMWMQNSKINDCFIKNSYYPIICVSASETQMCHKDVKTGNENDSERVLTTYTYVPGAGDDEESWSMGLTPQAFWPKQNKEAILAALHSSGNVDEVVRQAVHSYHCGSSSSFQGNGRAMGNDGYGDDAPSRFHPITWIATTGIGLGDCISGRPPDVWEHVDAVVNIGELEHDNMKNSSGNERNYLRIMLDTKSKHSLEQNLTSVIDFAYSQLIRGDRMLIHCDTGEDRSVCACLAILVELFDWHPDTKRLGGLRNMGGYDGNCSTSKDTNGDQKFNDCGERKNDDQCRPRRPIPPPTSKYEVRQRLAFLSAQYSRSRPSSLMLKQVYQFCSRHNQTSHRRA